jgi:hypothetical protein
LALVRRDSTFEPWCKKSREPVRLAGGVTKVTGGMDVINKFFPFAEFGPCDAFQWLEAAGDGYRRVGWAEFAVIPVGSQTRTDVFLTAA